MDSSTETRPIFIESQTSTTTLVTVVVPIRNEERYRGKCLESLLSQTYPSEWYEVLVVDGRSSDASLKIVSAMCERHSNLRILDNPAAIAPAAMNMGIRSAKGDIVIRADGHNFYPADYVENCVKYLNKTGADNVGGPWHTVPADETLSARIVAALLTNPFGVGDSRFRIGSYEGFVETVPFGAFRRDLFQRIGMYNEKLVRNQDNELNARIRANGGRIYQTPVLTTEYHPIARVGDLLRQTYRQSQWHVFSLRENIRSMRPRHFAPAALVIAGLALLAFATFSRAVLLVLIGLTVAYLLTSLLFTLKQRSTLECDVIQILPFAFLCFHVTYGLGTLAGLKYLFKTPSRNAIRPAVLNSDVRSAVDYE